MNNKLYKVLIFMFIVVIGAVSISLLPAFSFAGFEFKKVDALSEVKKVEIDSSSVGNKGHIIKPKFVDTCKTGVVCIEDFSDNHSGLSRFYDALIKNDAPVRIAYFGDSFIEGDLMTCSLRRMYKNKYGGNGAGFVPIKCLTAGFRLTVRTSASGWDEHCITDSAFNRSKQGISGYYFYPNQGATATFACKDMYGKNADTCSSASFFFITDGGLKFSTEINKGDKETHVLEGSPNTQKITVCGKIARVRITIENVGKNTVFFGAALDNEEKGITIDNFSLRGTSGMQLGSIPEKILRNFDSIRHYDLVVIQYGLNVAAANSTNFDGYAKSMTKAINRIKTNMPKSDILLVSVGDRAMRQNGDMVTMPGIKKLVLAQQQFAANIGIAFWNMVDAMALDGGIAGYVKAKPPKANLDYTHINIRGGDLVAKRLFEALEYGKKKYIERKKHDE